jgi:hypothetical protein
MKIFVPIKTLKETLILQILPLKSNQTKINN